MSAWPLLLRAAYSTMTAGAFMQHAVIMRERGGIGVGVELQVCFLPADRRSCRQNAAARQQIGVFRILYSSRFQALGSCTVSASQSSQMLDASMSSNNLVIVDATRSQGPTLQFLTKDPSPRTDSVPDVCEVGSRCASDRRGYPVVDTRPPVAADCAGAWAGYGAPAEVSMQRCCCRRQFGASSRKAPCHVCNLIVDIFGVVRALKFLLE